MYAGLVMVIVHSIECWDVFSRYHTFSKSQWKDYNFLRILAWSGNRTAVLRLIQAICVLQQGIRGIRTPPPPLSHIGEHTSQHVTDILSTVYSNRAGMIVIAVTSIIMGVWAMYDRHRALADWNRAGRPEISPE